MINAIIYLVVFMAIQMAITIGVREIWRLATGSPDITTLTLIVSMAASGIVTLAVFFSARWCSVSKSYVRSRPWGALFWSVMASVGAVIPSLWLQELMPELPNVLLDEFSMVLGDRMGYFVVGLLVPVAEELVFRGAIQRSLHDKGMGNWTAIAIAALLFALAHGNPAQMPHAFLAGLLLGWMYSRTRSVVPGVAYHWANNTIAYVMWNLFPNSDATLLEMFNGSQAHVYMALGFSLCILIPAIFQLNATLRRANV